MAVLASAYRYVVTLLLACFSPTVALPDLGCSSDDNLSLARWRRAERTGSTSCATVPSARQKKPALQQRDEIIPVATSGVGAAKFDGAEALSPEFWVAHAVGGQAATRAASKNFDGTATQSTRVGHGG